MYVNRRNRGRNRLVIFLVILVALVIGALFLFASMGGEQPAKLVEQPVEVGGAADKAAE